MMLHRAADRTALLPPFAWRTGSGRDHRFRRDGPRSSVRCAGLDDLGGTLGGRSSAISRDSGPRPVDRLAEKNSPV